MTKEEVISEFCKISAQVAKSVFKSELAADCFCTEPDPLWNYQYEGEVLDYIRAAVHEKMRRDIKLPHNQPPCWVRS